MNHPYLSHRIMAARDGGRARGLLFLNAMTPEQRMLPQVRRRWDPQFAGAHAAPRQMCLAGYATRYNRVFVNKGRYEVLAPGAFAKTLLDGNTVRMLDSHDEGICLATTNGGGLKLSSDDVGLSFAVDLPESADARRVYGEVEDGRKRGMSIGYLATEYHDDMIGGRQVRTVTAARLNEISPVTEGAVDYAFVDIAASGEPTRKSKEQANASGAFARIVHLLFELRQAMTDA